MLCLCRHEIKISNTSLLTVTSLAYPKLNVDWRHGFGKGMAKNFWVIVHCCCSPGMVKHPAVTHTVIILLNRPPANQGTGAYGNSMMGTSTYVHHSLMDNPAHLYLYGSHDYHSKSVINRTNFLMP